MPTDIALIRCFNRPEFLHHTLECVKRAWKPEGLALCAWIDTHNDDTPNQDVINQFRGSEIPLQVFYSRSSIGDSKSILGIIETSIEEGAQRIYNIEEDVLISPDFFRWHRAAHALGHYPLTVASNYHDDPRVSSDADPTAVFESPNSNPIGCCFSRWFAEMLVAHNTPNYYQNFETMAGYLGVNFPEFPSNVNLQWDGLMHRILQRNKLKCLYPLKPRAYHTGFYGANREVKDTLSYLTIKDKIKRVGEIIYDNEKLQEMSGGKADCRVYDLKESQWEKLVLL